MSAGCNVIAKWTSALHTAVWLRKHIKATELGQNTFAPFWIFWALVCEKLQLGGISANATSDLEIVSMCAAPGCKNHNRAIVFSWCCVQWFSPGLLTWVGGLKFSPSSNAKSFQRPNTGKAGPKSMCCPLFETLVVQCDRLVGHPKQLKTLRSLQRKEVETWDEAFLASRKHLISDKASRWRKFADEVSRVSESIFENGSRWDRGFFRVVRWEDLTVVVMRSDQ